MELYKIFENTVLTEGRKEEVMAKYPDVPKEVIEDLSQNDPSGNNKYLEWMVSQYPGVAAGRIELDSIKNVVKLYNSKLSMLTPENLKKFFEKNGGDVTNIEKIQKSPKDINSYTMDDLTLMTYFLDNLVSKKKFIDQMRKESDRIYEGDDLLVVSPRTHAASCHYGVHSTWCVATATSSHFSNYTRDGVLYFFVSKKNVAYTPDWAEATDGSHREGGQPANTPPFKVALLLKDNGNISWWSKNDNNFSNGWVGDPNLPFLTEEIADRILAHNKSAIQNRKQREIEIILKTKGFYKKEGGDRNLKSNFGGFVRSRMYTPEELVSIIRNDNWYALHESSELGENLRKTLGPDLVFSLTREMLSTVSDKKEVIKDMQKFLTEYGNQMSDEQNRELASTIIKIAGNKAAASGLGGEVGLYIDKWTISPEAMENYKNTSNYFFVGEMKPVEAGVGPDGEPKYKKAMKFESLVKVDRFNPQDRQVVKMLKLKAAHLKQGVYAIFTTKGLLDDYLKTPSNEIPESVMKMITEKATKVYPQ